MIGAQDTLVLRPSRKRWALVALGACALVAGGVAMIASGEGGLTRVIGWVAVVFFGLGVIVAVAELVTKNYLMLSSDGFTVRGLGGQYTTRWADVEAFSAIRPSSMYPVSKMVVYNFTPSYRRLPQVRRISRAIAGYEGGLPDTYGMKADHLAELMNDWRARYSS